MTEQETGRRLAAVLAADVAGYSRLAGADEERTLARLRALRGDLIDPAIAAHRGRTVKRAGDGTIVEFRSVIDAARCALEVQQGMVERNAGVGPERQILFRVGIHIGDVVGEADGDLMGDGVNIAARLEGICEPGGIVLSEDAYRQVRDRLEVSFADLGEQSLKNIARPVRIYAIGPQNKLTTPANAGVHRAAAATSTSMDPRVRGGGERELEAEQKREAAPRLSIVVLPFANIGGDPEQEYFVDGVTESLTTDLSRISGSFVIARNTAFTYKGKAVDLKQIGRDLNVLYVLEGSVQRGGNRLRVNVQLIDAETGNHLWAERFDKPVADLFDMQDEIVARLANQLNAELFALEANRAGKSLHPDSMDLYFQGMAALGRIRGAVEPVLQARELFERAVKLDPNNVEAMVAAAWADEMSGGGRMAADRARYLAASESMVTTALAMAPDHALGHFVLGNVYVFTDRADRAIVEYEQALMLNPNLASAHGFIGLAKINIGRPEECEAHVREALRLSPRDMTVSNWLTIAGEAKQHIGDDAEAIILLRRSIDGRRLWPLPHFFLAGSLALLGRYDEAQIVARTALALNPSLTIRRFRTAPNSTHPAYAARRERIYEGMRKAGVPEG